MLKAGCSLSFNKLQKNYSICFHFDNLCNPDYAPRNFVMIKAKFIMHMKRI